MKAYIYGLVDPRTGEIRYVGRTTTGPEWRIVGHLADARNKAVKSRKVQWIRELLDADLVPEIVVLEELEETEYRHVQDAERRWIAELAASGSLLNVSDAPDVKEYLSDLYARKAGGGVPIPPTAEEVRAFREARGWSQGRLAKELGYHYSTISLWESGRRQAPASIRLAMQRLEERFPPK